jgi:hypothetical protein
MPGEKRFALQVKSRPGAMRKQPGRASGDPGSAK